MQIDGECMKPLRIVRRTNFLSKIIAHCFNEAYGKLRLIRYVPFYLDSGIIIRVRFRETAIRFTNDWKMFLVSKNGKSLA